MLWEHVTLRYSCIKSIIKISRSEVDEIGRRKFSRAVAFMARNFLDRYATAIKMHVKGT